MVNKKILLTLSGTHGSGKSTNAGKCYYLLNKSGYKFSYLRNQDLLDPFGFIVRRAARILHVEPSKLEKTKPARIAWSIYLVYIYCPILVAGIWLRYLLGYSVVCDRYIYDVMVGFRDNRVTIPSENLLLRLLPRPNISFVLDAPEQRILTDRPEHSGDFIRMEKTLYRYVAEHFNLTRINTSDPPSVVWNTMLSDIRVVLGEKEPVEPIPIEQVIAQ
jgi:thymidylate kinase